MAVEAPNPQRVALVAGGTGLTGTALVRQLLNRTDYTRIFAVTRRPLPLDHPRLANRILPLEDVQTKLTGVRCQDAFCCIGATHAGIGQPGSSQAAQLRHVDLELVLKFARAAQALGASRFVVLSAAGADRNAAKPLLRVKGEMEAALRELRFAALDILQPGRVLGTRPQMSPGDLVANALLPVANPLLRGRFALLRGMTAGDLALAMIGAARSQRRGINIYCGPGLQALVGTGTPPSP